MTDPEYEIRHANASDAPALAVFGERTFLDAFAADNAPDDIAAYVAATYGAEHQARDLADPQRTTLVATGLDGGLVAYAQLRTGAPPAGVSAPAPIELLRFYVDRSQHGRGLAQALMAAVFETAAARGAGSIWLGVWERNHRAIAFYRKSGFTDVGSQQFVLGSDRQTDRIMVRTLEGRWPG